MAELTANPDAAYYRHCRADIIAAIPGRGLKVLDIGCGEGATLIELKRSGVAAEAVGVEANGRAIAANRRLLDAVIIGDIEAIDLPYDAGHFDVIIMADVLEHLIDPWSVLRKVRRYLRPAGVFIASLPNIREFSVVRSLLVHGDFRYADAGILDRTHLRFFCRKNMVELVGGAFEIVAIRRVPELARGEVAWFNRLTFRLFEEFLVLQYIIVARRAPDGGDEAPAA